MMIGLDMAGPGEVVGGDERPWTLRRVLERRRGRGGTGREAEGYDEVDVPPATAAARRRAGRCGEHTAGGWARGPAELHDGVGRRRRVQGPRSVGAPEEARRRVSVRLNHRQRRREHAPPRRPRRRRACRRRDGRAPTVSKRRLWEETDRNLGQRLHVRARAVGRATWAGSGDGAGADHCRGDDGRASCGHLGLDPVDHC